MPSGQKTFSPRITFAKRRWQSWSCLSHPSQSRDNIFFISPTYDACHKLLIRVSKLFGLILHCPGLVKWVKHGENFLAISDVAPASDRIFLNI